MAKVKVNVFGLSVSQTQTGAYALVLAEENGESRIPIIIGPVEAQSIAIQLEGLKPQRPLTHDLFRSMASAFQIELVEVLIYKLEEGIFYSELVCESNGSRVAIDARTSDAVALALRFECPIYITDDILEKAGFIFQFVGDSDSIPDEKEKLEGGMFLEYSNAELEIMMAKAISEEAYERASEIRDEIEKRNKEKKQ